MCDLRQYRLQLMLLDRRHLSDPPIAYRSPPMALVIERCDRCYWDASALRFGFFSANPRQNLLNSSSCDVPRGPAS